MEKHVPFICQVVQIIFLLALMLCSSHCNAQGRPRITDLDCYNDYLTEMFCSWRVPDSNTSCSDDFQLEYKVHYSSIPSHCVPENIAVSDAMPYTGCICYIKAVFFLAADEYSIQVKSHGIYIKNTTIFPALKVKPKAPVDVTIEHNGDTAKAQWDSCYTNEDYLFQKLNYDVQITSKQEPTEVKSIILDYMEPHYIIRKRLFLRGHDYLMKIRSKPNNYFLYDGIWSKWSPAVQWHNDYDLSAYDIIRNIMPGIASGIIICILLCFVCVQLCKRKWWNNIPDPSRSQLARTMLYTSQVLAVKSDMNCNVFLFEDKRKKKETICGKWLKKLISRNQDTTDQKNEIYKTRYINCMNRSEVNSVLIPEVTAVERSIKLSPVVLDTDLQNEPKQSEENDEELQPLECDFINRMFLEILKVDNKEEKLMDVSCNLDTENMNGSLFLRDISYEDGRFMTLPSSYTTGNSPPETQNEDFNSDQVYSFWKDSSASVQTLNYDGSYLDTNCNLGMLLDSDYKSFSTAKWQYKTSCDYSDSMPGDDKSISRYEYKSELAQPHYMKINCNDHNFKQNVEAGMLTPDTLCNNIQIILQPNSE